VGNPDASEVIKRSTSADPDDLMPPPDHGKPLKAEEIDLLRLWIKEGGHYQAAIQRYLAVTHLASLTVVANIILNLDSFLTK
jgi:hypothetical protein